jgi:hypothetical protein
MSEPREPADRAPSVKKRRMNKRTVRLLAWGAGFLSFGLPWAAFRLAPGQLSAASQQPQVLVVPAGSKVVITKSPSGGPAGVTVVTAKGTSTTSAVTTTRASAPVPKV